MFVCVKISPYDSCQTYDDEFYALPGKRPHSRFYRHPSGSICGDNRHGKSAIIDAMTWALWEKPAPNADDDLIHQNATEMEVEFEFAVGEQHYRIIRKHSRPKRKRASGQSSLNFQIAPKTASVPLTATRFLRPSKNYRCVHMDYSTFTNSAFFTAGHADEFTTSSRPNASTVLVNILGLSYYDGFETQR